MSSSRAAAARTASQGYAWYRAALDVLRRPLRQRTEEQLRQAHAWLLRAWLSERLPAAALALSKYYKSGAHAQERFMAEQRRMKWWQRWLRRWQQRWLPAAWSQALEARHGRRREEALMDASVGGRWQPRRLDPLPTDYFIARRYLMAAALAGMPQAQYEAALDLREVADPDALALSCTWLRRLAESPDADAVTHEAQRVYGIVSAANGAWARAERYLSRWHAREATQAGSEFDAYTVCVLALVMVQRYQAAAAAGDARAAHQVSRAKKLLAQAADAGCTTAERCLLGLLEKSA